MTALRRRGLPRCGAPGTPWGLGSGDGFICGCMVFDPKASLSLVPTVLALSSRQQPGGWHQEMGLSSR